MEDVDAASTVVQRRTEATPDKTLEVLKELHKAEAEKAKKRKAKKSKEKKDASTGDEDEKGKVGTSQRTSFAQIGAAPTTLTNNPLPWYGCCTAYLTN